MNTEPWAAPAAAVIAAAGLALAFRWAWPRPAGRRGNAPTFQCPHCDRTFAAHAGEMREVRGSDRGLMVAAQPELVGRRLVECACPHCGAELVLEKTRRGLALVAHDLISPQTAAARCMETGRAVRKPPWPAGTYDGRLAEAPEITDDIGMRCGRCSALVAWASVRAHSKGGAREGCYRCPRCNAYAVDRFYHG